MKNSISIVDFNIELNEEIILPNYAVKACISNGRVVFYSESDRHITKLTPYEVVAYSADFLNSKGRWKLTISTYKEIKPLIDALKNVAKATRDEYDEDITSCTMFWCDPCWQRAKPKVLRLFE